MSKNKKPAFNNHSTLNDYYKSYLSGADYYDELANEFEALVRSHKEEHNKENTTSGSCSTGYNSHKSDLHNKANGYANNADSLNNNNSNNSKSSK